MGSECWNVWYVDIFVNYGFYEHKADAGDRMMVWLMISRVDNARWRSLSNRESGCMKKRVEKDQGGRKMDIKQARKQIQCVWKRECRAAHTSHNTFVLLLMKLSFADSYFFHTSHCSTDHPAQEFFNRRVFEGLYYAALRNISFRVIYLISHRGIWGNFSVTIKLWV